MDKRVESDEGGGIDTVSLSEWLELYRQMYTIRVVEESLLSLFDKGQVSGTVHTCIGQEACAVGVINALNRDTDIVTSNHRGHGHFLSNHDKVEELICEILGKETGLCRGVGGSQHKTENA